MAVNRIDEDADNVDEGGYLKRTYSLTGWLEKHPGCRRAIAFNSTQQIGGKRRDRALILNTTEFIKHNRGKHRENLPMFYRHDREICNETRVALEVIGTQLISHND